MKKKLGIGLVIVGVALFLASFPAASAADQIGPRWASLLGGGGMILAALGLLVAALAIAGGRRS